MLAPMGAGCSAPMGAQRPWALSVHTVGAQRPWVLNFSGKWNFNFRLTSNFMGASGYSAHTAPISAYTAPISAHHF